MKRDKAFINSKLYIKDNKIYTKEKTILEFPKWYQDKELASIQEIAYIYGIFAIIIDDRYSVSIIPTLIPTVPILVNEIEKDGIEYVQFIYGKDDCLIEDISIVKHDILSYNFFESFFMYAREPWYVEYEDLVRIMDNLQYYAKSGVGDNHIASEIVSSFITRSKNDKQKFYRETQKGSYEYVELMNVYYSTLSIVHKLGGNYFKNSLVSAITQPSTKSSKLEELVK